MRDNTTRLLEVKYGEVAVKIASGTIKELIPDINPKDIKGFYEWLTQVKRRELINNIAGDKNISQGFDPNQLSGLQRALINRLIISTVNELLLGFTGSKEINYQGKVIRAKNWYKEFRDWKQQQAIIKKGSQQTGWDLTALDESKTKGVIRWQLEKNIGITDDLQVKKFLEYFRDVVEPKYHKTEHSRITGNGSSTKEKLGKSYLDINIAEPHLDGTFNQMVMASKPFRYGTYADISSKWDGASAALIMTLWKEYNDWRGAQKIVSKGSKDTGWNLSALDESKKAGRVTRPGGAMRYELKKNIGITDELEIKKFLEYFRDVVEPEYYGPTVYSGRKKALGKSYLDINIAEPYLNGTFEQMVMDIVPFKAGIHAVTTTSSESAIVIKNLWKGYNDWINIQKNVSKGSQETGWNLSALDESYHSGVNITAEEEQLIHDNSYGLMGKMKLVLPTIGYWATNYDIIKDLSYRDNTAVLIKSQGSVYHDSIRMLRIIYPDVKKGDIIYINPAEYKKYERDPNITPTIGTVPVLVEADVPGREIVLIGVKPGTERKITLDKVFSTDNGLPGWQVVKAKIEQYFATKRNIDRGSQETGWDLSALD